MNDKIQSFFHAYNVKSPNRRVRVHQPEFVQRALSNVDFLIKNTLDEEILAALRQVRENWISAAGFVPATDSVDAQPAKAVVVSFREVVNTHNLARPDSFRVTSADEAREYREKILQVVRDGGGDLSRDCVSRLQRWARGWKDIERKYAVDTSDLSEKKGPPASYLARKRAKAAESQQTRNRLRGKK
jgi:hypothetical protein